jgi:general secretion pathway protein G
MAVGSKSKRTGDGHGATAGRKGSAAYCHLPTARCSGGWTLIELVITMTVMSVLALGAIPMLKVAVRRQKEQQLRDSLRTMRDAIKEFRRDTAGMQCTGVPGAPAGDAAATPPNTAQPPQPGQQQTLVDPRSTVVMADCTIFGVDNLDRYPPDLETLVKGVKVVPRQPTGAQTLGSVQGNFLDRQQGALAFKTKVYLREVPADPMTGEKDWIVCSSWEPQDADACGGKENAFDVRSRSQAVPLDGKGKYSDW